MMIIKCGRVEGENTEGGRAWAETSAKTLSAWSGGADTKAASAAFKQELVDTCDAGSKDDMGELDKYFVENVTRGKLGKELIPMRVGTMSVNQWVVCEMPPACGCEDAMLARVARELLVFPYANNIPVVVAAAMDTKVKAPTPIYWVVNLEWRSRKWKARPADPAAGAKPEKVAKCANVGGKPVGKEVVSSLGVENFCQTRI